MKNLLPALLFLLISLCGFTQTDSTEKIIRALETADYQAVLMQDTATMNRLLSRDIMVNAPFNRILRRSGVDSAKGGAKKFTSFQREIEQILLKDNVAITMGNETVVAAPNNPNADKIVRRRFTNVWMKENGSWKLIARHSSQICQ